MTVIWFPAVSLSPSTPVPASKFLYSAYQWQFGVLPVHWFPKFGHCCHPIPPEFKSTCVANQSHRRKSSTQLARFAFRWNALWWNSRICTMILVNNTTSSNSLDWKLILLVQHGSTHPIYDLSSSSITRTSYLSIIPMRGCHIMVTSTTTKRLGEGCMLMFLKQEKLKLKIFCFHPC